MGNASKSAIISATAMLTFAFGAAPAQAQNSSDFDFTTPAPATVTTGGAQVLTTANGWQQTVALEKLSEATILSYENIAHGFDINAAIAKALSEVGTSRATGWNMPGECIMSTQRWVRAGGGNWSGSGTPVSNYVGATRVPLAALKPGDVIQYEHLTFPHSWATGVHTMLVTGVNTDGTIDIVQSNVPAGSGLVTVEKNFVINPPAGFQAVGWRF